MSQECRQLWGMILDGLSYQQMSQHLNVSEGSLRVRVMRCRKKAVAVRDQLLGQQQGAAM
ncbi:MAG: sigma-70 family RNA polymerase sigma factor [Acidobacteria bacterium]|nr:sigma-70 family RNA polymerase sigma factor [Acidobacteriota bacterium]